MQQLWSSVGKSMVSLGKKMEKAAEKAVGPAAEDLAKKATMKSTLQAFFRNAESSFVAPTADSLDGVYAGCTVLEGGSVWYNAKLGNGAIIGKYSNVQESAKVGINTVLGSHVSVGPCSSIGSNSLVDDFSFIGACAKIGDNVKLMPGSVISPGSHVQDGKTLTAGLWSGTPAQFVRALNATEMESIKKTAEATFNAASAHASICKPLEEVAADRLKRDERVYFSDTYMEDNPGRWDVYVSIVHEPDFTPDRAGQIFDKKP